MQISRRLFIRDGVATVALGLTAPAFLSAIAQAQGLSSRRLVVVYLGGGNDALNTLIPYQDQSYYSRRPTIAIPAGQVLQVGTDAAGRALGLHPRLGGLSNIFNEGRLAIVQRTGYQNSSRSHFEATDIFGTANPQSSTGSGWLGRYLDTLPRPIDSLAAWNTTSETPRSLVSGQTGVPAISNASTYTFASPNRGSAAAQERAAAEAMAANAAPGRPHLAFVNGTSRSAIETIDRAARALSYQPTVAYPNNGFALALRTVAGAIFNGIGSRVYYVQTGGYDTHAEQGAGGGSYGGLMGTLGDGLAAFYTDIRNRGLASDTTDHRVLGIRPPHLRERQRRHRSRRGGTHVRAGRLGARRAVRHGRVAAAGRSHSREQLRRRSVRNGLPIRVREGARPMARRQLGADPER